MSFCVRLIGLALLFLSALAASTPTQFYLCGEKFIKLDVVRAAVAEGCSRYHGNSGCSSMNCLKPSSIPAPYRGNHFPANHQFKIKWPLKIKAWAQKTKNIGFVVMEISHDKCSLVGSIYKLRNADYAVCTGPFTKESLNRLAELERSRSGSQRQTQKEPEPSFFQTPGGTRFVSRKKS